MKHSVHIALLASVLIKNIDDPQPSHQKDDQNGAHKVMRVMSIIENHTDSSMVCGVVDMHAQPIEEFSQCRIREEHGNLLPNPS